MQGRGHARDGLPCQDKTYAFSEGGAICVALADGAGSARYSHFGADAVVHYVAKRVCTDFEAFYAAETPSLIRSELLKGIETSLKTKAEELKCATKELASTLLFAAQKDGRFLIGQLGDGCIAFLREGECRLVTKPEKGEFANMTFFTTSSNAEKHFKLFRGELNSIEGFFLMSDGAAESLYQRNSDTLAPLVTKLIREAFCKSDAWLRCELRPLFEKGVLQRTMDDCSIAILTTIRNHRELLDSLDKSELFKMFFKRKQFRKMSIQEEYIDILLTSEQTSDIRILADLTGISLGTLKRRLSRLRKLGFREATKYEW